MSSPNHPRGGRLIAFVFAISAVVVVPLVLDIGFGGLVGPNAVFRFTSNSLRARMTWEGSGSWKVTWEPGGSYSVHSFGYELLTRTASDPSRFETECLLWQSIPPLKFLGVCGVLGWHFGRWVSYRMMNHGPAKTIPPASGGA